MLETLLGRAGATKKHYIDINFEDAQVGSRSIIDRGTLGVAFNRTVSGGVNNDGVIDDPIFGKCYKFDGTSVFVGNKHPGLWNKQYRMELKFVNIGMNSSQIICAGDYPYAGGQAAGWELATNQYPDTYMQMFLINANVVYTRLLLPGTNPGPSVLETIIVTRIGSVITMSNPRTGQSVGVNFDTQADYLLHVGGGYVNNYSAAFQGLLKSYTVELLS